jgi:hypothetical protein
MKGGGCRLIIQAGNRSRVIAHGHPAGTKLVRRFMRQRLSKARSKKYWGEVYQQLTGHKYFGMRVA